MKELILVIRDAENESAWINNTDQFYEGVQNSNPFLAILTVNNGGPADIVLVNKSDIIKIKFA